MSADFPKWNWLVLFVKGHVRKPNNDLTTVIEIDNLKLGFSVRHIVSGSGPHR
jgi:hypothetical protein